MCGIWFSLGLQAPQEVRSLLAHRGPDGDGSRVFQTEAGPLTIEHCRLAIIDTGVGAAQPMSDPDGRFWLTYNGEIYNYLELRRDLEATGFCFRTHSDTEVLLAAYIRWGIDCLSRFVGMFAFALYDVKAGRVLLARDPFGIKPLFYAALPHGLAAASEIKALLRLPDIDRRINNKRLFGYLHNGRSDHGDGTMFAAIRQIPAGHYALLDIRLDAAIQPIAYWRPQATSAPRVSRREASMRLREMFLESVRMHLRSDVPLGVLLSGGIDSSAILLAARKILGPEAALPSFSYFAEEDSIDESAWAHRAAAAAGADHHIIRISGGSISREIDELIAQQDEPFASTSVYAQHRVFAAVRGAGLKVVLDGQGADEMLAGYPTYLSDRLISLVSGGRVDQAAKLLLAAHQKGRARTMLRAISAFLPASLDLLGRRLLGEASVPAWLDPGWVKNAQPPVERVLRSGHALHDRLIATLTETSLPALLRYEDRNAMNWSVESRLPFLTTPLAEFILSLPEELLIDNSGTTKSVFRDAMRGIVPDAILDRRDKIGFATPQRRWLEALRPWLADVFNTSAASEFSAIRRSALVRIRSQLAAGEIPCFDWLWRCANAIRWLEISGARL